MRVIAFHLPQYHSIPENDEWWGEGFTDWTNVKKSITYYKGQYQPRVPLNNFYYDLSKIETLKWQADLANRYSIYGFCFYHYWFSGKLLLEKPVENLLSHPEIQINYCFSWANEPWSRTWTGQNKQVLISQSYGGEEDWIAHFNYLLPFFKDDRYIKENNMPMFLIYKSALIKRCGEMMRLWNQLAIEAGFDGVHFVETLNRGYEESRILPFHAKVEFEPAIIKSFSKLYSIRLRRWSVRYINKLFKTSIPETKKILFEQEVERSCRNIAPEGTYAGVFVGWDNTPRRGLAATYIVDASKEQFKSYLQRKLQIAKEIYKTDYLFVNAWNEWAEGTYLEPDEKHQYEYLEAIHETLSEI